MKKWEVWGIDLEHLYIFADSFDEAWKKAYSADKMSIFGGIVVSNRELTSTIATEMSEMFLEVIVAPSYTEEALEILKKKKNVRVLLLPEISVKQPENS